MPGQRENPRKMFTNLWMSWIFHKMIQITQVFQLKFLWDLLINLCWSLSWPTSCRCSTQEHLKFCMLPANLLPASCSKHHFPLVQGWCRHSSGNLKCRGSELEEDAIKNAINDLMLRNAIVLSTIETLDIRGELHPKSLLHLQTNTLRYSW